MLQDLSIQKLKINVRKSETENPWYTALSFIM